MNTRLTTTANQSISLDYQNNAVNSNKGGKNQKAKNKTPFAETHAELNYVIELIELNALVLSEKNVRKKYHDDSIKRLAELIFQHGLLHPLFVTAEIHQEKKMYGVVAGGRRLAALQFLHSQGKISNSYKVECKIVSSLDGIEVSILENSGRLEMHPVEEFRAFARMVQEGKSVEDISAKFGVSPIVVSRRLRLAKVSPKLLDLSLTDKLSLDRLIAFAIVDDHQLQEQAYQAVCNSINNSAQTIRRYLMRDSLPISDRKVKFVGIEAYLEAGGHIINDLFSDAGDGYIQEVALLNTLIEKKFAEIESSLSSIAWFSGQADMQEYELRQHFIAIECELSEPNELQATMLKKFQSEYDQLEKKIEEVDYEYNQVHEEQMDVLQEQIESIHSQLKVIPERYREVAGAVAIINQAGEANVLMGMVKREDYKKLNQIEKAQEKELSPTTGHSAKLNRNITGQQTAILQNLVALRPHIALPLLVSHLLAKHFQHHCSKSIFQLNVVHTRLEHDVPNIEETTAFIEYQRLVEGVIPSYLANSTQAEVIAWCISQEVEKLLQVLAVCISATINVISEKDEKPFVAELIERVTPIDYPAFWQPTAANYLDMVSKGTMLDLVLPHLEDGELKEFSALKKNELIVRTEDRLMGRDWLPLAMRKKEV
ncbi:ParB/RepB/Spo0J family partition protein (plasmid) [Ampullimonas aquatilis]|uniref:ParB/RepB/Spo0J family partition protein n=1 Tax=Ampullimonas aquatilis TaxID=1341549 RepID=UPI003C73FE9E